MIFRVKLLIYQGVEVTTAWENGTDAKMDGCICATSRLFDQHTQWCRMLTQIMGYIYIYYMGTLAKVASGLVINVPIQF